MCGAMVELLLKMGGVYHELDYALDEPIWHGILLGINMGFWVGMAAVLLIVVLMNVVFWSLKPKKPDQIS